MGFTKTADGYVKVYTDGSYKAPNGGIGVFFNDPQYNVSCKVQDPVRSSNEVEILAATKALTELKKYGEMKVNLFTDSQAFKLGNKDPSSSHCLNAYNNAKTGMDIHVHQVGRDDPSLKEAHKLAFNAV